MDGTVPDEPSVPSFHSVDMRAFWPPSIFPEKLAEDQILTWSNPGEIVYDTFLGSGTTAVVAKQLSRNWLASEISAEYFDLALERFSACGDR
jgi:DNA modification methylase